MGSNIHSSFLWGDEVSLPGHRGVTAYTVGTCLMLEVGWLLPTVGTGRECSVAPEASHAGGMHGLSQGRASAGWRLGVGGLTSFRRHPHKGCFSPSFRDEVSPAEPVASRLWHLRLRWPTEASAV